MPASASDMRKALILRFFKELDRELKRPAEIILTGAAAGSLLGVVRPSLDIDFEIRTQRAKKMENFSNIRDAIQKAAEKAGIAVNYSEDIGHWSMIDLLDYRKSALSYRKIGRLHLKVMEPSHWTIGKMGRFLEVDIRDMIRMVRRKKLKPEELIDLWARALGSSPLSLNLGIFSRNVTYFIRHYGKRLWGKAFDADKMTALFEKTAGINKKEKKIK